MIRQAVIIVLAVMGIAACGNAIVLAIKGIDRGEKEIIISLVIAFICLVFMHLMGGVRI